MRLNRLDLVRFGMFTDRDRYVTGVAVVEQLHARPLDKLDEQRRL